MSCLGNLFAVCVCVSEHERGPEKPQSENYVSSERIRSPRFSQGVRDPAAVMRDSFMQHKHTHTHSVIFALISSENPGMRSTKARERR